MSRLFSSFYCCNVESDSQSLKTNSLEDDLRTLVGLIFFLWKSDFLLIEEFPLKNGEIKRLALYLSFLLSLAHVYFVCEECLYFLPRDIFTQKRYLSSILVYTILGIADINRKQNLVTR